MSFLENVFTAEESWEEWEWPYLPPEDPTARMRNHSSDETGKHPSRSKDEMSRRRVVPWWPTKYQFDGYCSIVQDI